MICENAEVVQRLQLMPQLLYLTRLWRNRVHCHANVRQSGQHEVEQQMFVTVLLP